MILEKVWLIYEDILFVSLKHFAESFHQANKLLFAEEYIYFLCTIVKVHILVMEFSIHLMTCNYVGREITLINIKYPLVLLFLK